MSAYTAQHVRGLKALRRPVQEDIRMITASWRSIRRVLTILTILAWPAVGYAQQAIITGTVTDSSGAPVPSSDVTTRNVETGATRIARTDNAGRYLLLSLPIGEYEVRAAKTGFQDAVRTGSR